MTINNFYQTLHFSLFMKYIGLPVSKTFIILIIHDIKVIFENKISSPFVLDIHHILSTIYVHCKCSDWTFPKLKKQGDNNYCPSTILGRVKVHETHSEKDTTLIRPPWYVLQNQKFVNRSPVLNESNQIICWEGQKWFISNFTFYLDFH